MDIDSLGTIISQGLQENNTFSRVSTLSTSLDLFFKGYVPNLIQSYYKDSIYLVYSGGDDVFAIGAWDKIIYFAYQLYKDFRRFTAYNPDITLSAGIVLENSSYPIIKGAIAAENALESAKNFESYSKTQNLKNKVSIFGKVLSWDWKLVDQQEMEKIAADGKMSYSKYILKQILKIMKSTNEEGIKRNLSAWIIQKSEFELAHILKTILVYLIKNNYFSKSVLQKMESSIIGMRSLLRQSLERRVEVPKLWRIKYYLRSFLKSKKNHVILFTNFIIELFEIIVKNNLFQTDPNLQIKNVEFISVAVRWADYSTRKIKN